MRTFRLLICSLMALSGAHAQIYSNKTFLKTREVASFFLPVDQIHRRENTSHHTTEIDATLFHRSAHNHREMGTYFAFGHAHRNTLEPLIEVITGDDVNESQRFNTDFFFSENTNPSHSTNYANCSVRLRPTCDEYGMTIRFTRHISKQLSVSLSAPLKHVETSMNALFTDSREVDQNYFRGARVDKDKHDMQQQLAHQRISYRCNPS